MRVLKVVWFVDSYSWWNLRFFLKPKNIEFNNLNGIFNSHLKKVEEWYIELLTAFGLFYSEEYRDLFEFFPLFQIGLMKKSTGFCRAVWSWIYSGSNKTL